MAGGRERVEDRAQAGHRRGVAGLALGGRQELEVALVGLHAREDEGPGLGSHGGGDGHRGLGRRGAAAVLADVDVDEDAHRGHRTRRAARGGELGGERGPVGDDREVAEPAQRDDLVDGARRRVAREQDVAGETGAQQAGGLLPASPRRAPSRPRAAAARRSTRTCGP